DRGFDLSDVQALARGALPRLLRASLLVEVRLALILHHRDVDPDRVDIERSREDVLEARDRNQAAHDRRAQIADTAAAMERIRRFDGGGALRALVVARLLFGRALRLELGPVLRDRFLGVELVAEEQLEGNDRLVGV